MFLQRRTEANVQETLRDPHTPRWSHSATPGQSGGSGKKSSGGWLGMWGGVDLAQICGS